MELLSHNAFLCQLVEDDVQYMSVHTGHDNLLIFCNLDPYDSHDELKLRAGSIHVLKLLVTVEEDSLQAGHVNEDIFL